MAGTQRQASDKWLGLYGPAKLPAFEREGTVYAQEPTPNPLAGGHRLYYPVQRDAYYGVEYIDTGNPEINRGPGNRWNGKVLIDKMPTQWMPGEIQAVWGVHGPEGPVTHINPGRIPGGWGSCPPGYRYGTDANGVPRCEMIPAGVSIVVAGPNTDPAEQTKAAQQKTAEFRETLPPAPLPPEDSQVLPPANEGTNAANTDADAGAAPTAQNAQSIIDGSVMIGGHAIPNVVIIAAVAIGAVVFLRRG